MSESPQIHTIVCEEVFDENSVPSEEEVLEYAAKIGIDTKTEHHLLPIALNGLMHPLPPEWKPCYDQDLKKWYYYNTETKKSQWEHPLDPVYRQIVKRGRSEGYSSAGDDDSKTTAKEDLKSFEEASDILSSRSVDIKPEVGFEKKDNINMERGPLLKGSQPLLLRRKQLQSGQDPLHVAKLINSTLRQSLPKDDESPVQRRSLSDLPAPAPALRRSHTSDLITTHPPPIKGILRESSFSGSMSSSNRPSSVRYAESGGHLLQDVEDEKKRSVRFADSEKKSLDIRFQLSDSEEMYSEVDDDDDEDEEISSGSPVAEKDTQEAVNEGKPKILSPLKKNDNPFSVVLQKKDNSDPPRIPKKFTVTPVTLKDPPFGYPLSDLKGLFKQESVGPLDSDSDLSSGIKGGESLITGVNRSSESHIGEIRRSPAEHDLYGSMVKDPQKSPTKILERDNDLKPSSGSIDVLAPTKEVSSSPSDLKKRLASESAVDITEYASALSLQDVSSAEPTSKERSDDRLNLQEKLDEELEEEVKELKVLQKNKLETFKKELLQIEEHEINKLKEESDENLKKVKESLEAEYQQKEQELREFHKLQLENLSKQLENEREEELEALRKKNRETIEKWKLEQEEALKEERIRLDNESFERTQKSKAELAKKLDELKAEEEAQIEEFIKSNEKRLEEMKVEHEEAVKELNAKHQSEIREIEESYKLRIEVLRKDKETELKMCEGEWEDRMTAMTLSQKARLDSVGKEYEGRLGRLKADWEREESETRRRRMMSDQQSVPVDYEKLRCEKRLLEDKYRTLKEKYCQLKTDMKMAVEKKLQARAKRKKEELESGSIPPERPRNLNTELQSSSLVAPRITVGEVSPRDVTDPSSDEQFTLSSNMVEKYGTHKKSRSPRRDHTPTGSRANEGTRGQLEDVEENSGTIYLNHPLNSLGLSRSAEIDYYRQRMIVEDDQARVIGDCLEDQRCSLTEARGAVENNNIIDTLHQDRDLDDLEVSIQRTRQFFSDKMLRLRLLGQTLSRLADHTTSPPNYIGEDAIATSNVLQNLDNINAEIREIWTQLNRNQSTGLNNGSGVSDVKTEPKTKTKSSSHHHQTHRPSKRSEIQARLQGLQDWLQTPPPADWAQLTL